MLTKIKTHLSTPITWGKYYRLAGICGLLGGLLSAAAVLKYLYDWGYWHLPKLKKKTDEEEP